jgi:hypothetical protein
MNRWICRTSWALVALLVAGSALARTPPTPKAVAEARHLCEVARELRLVRIPLLQRRATANINQSLDQLERIGVKIDRRVPIIFDSARELTLLRQAGALLRGATPGSDAYALHKQVTMRARELHHTTFGMPRGMVAYTNGAKEQTELLINLDNPTFGKPAQLFPVVAHEHRHVRDLARSRRLEQAIEKTPDGVERQRLEGKLAIVLSHPLAETRAFRAQAFALGRLGKPLGIWWRAPQSPEIDGSYPPAKINKALVQGYFDGISQTMGSAMRDASPARRQIAASYLRGYRLALEQQADAYYQKVRADAQRDPQAIDRYNAAAGEILKRVEKTLGGSAPLGAAQAFLVGQADAIVGSGPVRAQTLLAN